MVTVGPRGMNGGGLKGSVEWYPVTIRHRRRWKGEEATPLLSQLCQPDTIVVTAWQE